MKLVLLLLAASYMFIDVPAGILLTIGTYFVLFLWSLLEDLGDSDDVRPGQRGGSIWTFLLGMAIGAVIFGGDE